MTLEEAYVSNDRVSCSLQTRISLSLKQGCLVDVSEDHMDTIKYIAKHNSHEASAMLHLQPRVAAKTVFDMHLETRAVELVMAMHAVNPPHFAYMDPLPQQIGAAAIKARQGLVPPSEIVRSECLHLSPCWCH